MSLRLALLAAACTLVLVGCGGGDSGSTVAGEPIGFQELAQSASTSADATSGRFAFGMSLSMPGSDESFSFSGEGAFDAVARRSSLELDMSAFAQLLGGLVAGLGVPDDVTADAPDFDDPTGWRIEAVQDGDVAYLRFPALDERLPAGKTWVRMEKGASVQGFQLEQFTSSDPRELLAALRAVTGEIETIGTEELRGDETTHYRALVDPAELGERVSPEQPDAGQSLVDQITAQSGLGEIPVDIWLDASGLVRKLSLEVSEPEKGTASISFELWDFGEPVEIALPPASQVVDESAVRG